MEDENDQSMYSFAPLSIPNSICRIGIMVPKENKLKMVESTLQIMLPNTYLL